MLGMYDFYYFCSGTLVYWIGVSSCTIGIIVLCSQYIPWMISIKSIGFSNISLSQQNCLLHILIFAFFGGLFYAITVAYQDEYDKIYFTMLTAIECTMTLGLIIADSRLYKLDTSIKEVSITPYKMSKFNFYHK
jgi:hypothetical protein